MQALAEVHDTSLNVPPGPGFGVAWTVHELPFQASARVMEGPLLSWPTAVHTLAEMHDTAEDSLSLGRAGGFGTEPGAPFPTPAPCCYPPGGDAKPTAAPRAAGAPTPAA